MKKQIHVIGADHIDLAWKKGPDEMADLLVNFVVRVLDLLDTYPEFTYVLEQASHYRRLIKERPDLVKRLKAYLSQGRLEFVGGMASTLETNIPCGEAFIRNQMLGMKWLKDNMDVEISTGWLVDTFGLHAQIPQILRQFGIRYLMANRFGGEKYHDVFHAVGLDGSRVLVAGKDHFSVHIRNARVFFTMAGIHQRIDALFDLVGMKASEEGSSYVMPYLENEGIPTPRLVWNVQKKQKEKTDQEWFFSIPRHFFQSLEKEKHSFPDEFGDLNPEFTGTFGARYAIKEANRRVESFLLQAEQWMALCGKREKEDCLHVEEAWWTMAYVHFHDVFTGSHPTSVFKDLMFQLKTVEANSMEVLNHGLGTIGSCDGMNSKDLEFTLINSLPWERWERVEIPVAKGNPVLDCKVVWNGNDLPTEIHDGKIGVMTRIPPGGCVQVKISQSGKKSESSFREVEHAVLENEFIRFSVDKETGIQALIHKPSGRELISNAGDFLIVQREEGGFQIENPKMGELRAVASGYRIDLHEETSVAQRMVLKGEFPGVYGNEKQPASQWEMEWTLGKKSPKLDLKIKVYWKAEGSRLRLKIPTNLDASTGLFEVPFGVVKRKPYVHGFNKKGEWPAQRFVVLEDGSHGVALINTGVPGVEVMGGCLWTTLLRSPVESYAGMNADDTSSQHGEHHFQFALVPYQGTWSQTGITRFAQELNAPVLCFPGKAVNLKTDTSYFSLSHPHVVFSCVKLPEDGIQDEILLRFYESTGNECSTDCVVLNASQAWSSSLQEEKGDAIPCQNGRISCSLKPFEIKTIRFKLS